MLKWTIVIAFNMAYGLIAGFITSRIFNSRRWDTHTWYYAIDMEDIKMILQVAVASTLIGILCYLVFPTRSRWMLSGFVLGNLLPIVTFFFKYLDSLHASLLYNAKLDVVVDTKLKLAMEIYRSFSFVQFFVLSLCTLLYAWVFLLVPILGLGWGYLLYTHVNAFITKLN
ncbi:MAG: hypothetical protein ACKVOQ_04280 [Cyclobacteriaceae bacterium]